MKFGLIKSKLDGTENKYESLGLNIPKRFSYLKCLPAVINQGNEPICVPCSVSTFVNWKINLENGSRTDNKVDLQSIFKNGGTDEGMTFKDALHFIRHSGVSTTKGLFKIDKYAMIGSIDQLKEAIIANGPCIGGLPAYKAYGDFWNGQDFIGGHAVAIIGYDENGFILRNSWGASYGHDGYYHLPYDDFNKFYEIWTLI